MLPEIWLLVLTAAVIGLFHTLIGPDHYLPFIVMSKARGWSLPRTTLLTLLCGVGHVGSSVVIGCIGIAMGLAVGRLEAFEGSRGSIAAWAFIAFGLVYMTWGIHRALRKKTHEHSHLHLGGLEHTHAHDHTGEHTHAHTDMSSKKAMTPWVLFVIFVLGPCEPLIPILMYPAAKGGVMDVVLVTLVFSIATISTMLTLVVAAFYGMQNMPFKRLERWAHSLAGGAIAASGLGMVFLGL